ncbi:esterase [Clostridium botulinum]|uniref:esterase n=1 Tax=Clostridium botulinum TaxID=1491 RepID=UPI001FA7E17D|nr:esterase [Clostridium botulinum]
MKGRDRVLLKVYFKRVVSFSIIVVMSFIFLPITANADSHTYSDEYGSRMELTNIKNSEDFNLVKFKKLDESYARNEWIHQSGENQTCGPYSIWTYFGDDYLNVDGWFQVDGKWYYSYPYHDSDYYGIARNCFVDDYYLGNDGALVKNAWIKEDIYEWGNLTGCNWYYIGSDGKALKNAITPDGYKVDNRGIWI